MQHKLKEEISKRKREADAETRKLAAKHRHGRDMDDAQAMRRPDVKAAEQRARKAPSRAARMAVYQAEESHKDRGLELDEGEVADRVTQADILQSVDEQTRRKSFSIKLDQLGPYACDFSPNGTDVALCGLRGHLATFRWQQFDLQGEVQLKDKCTDVKYLVDGSMLAVAQKRFVYMYTKAGVEMHLLKAMQNQDRLEYLPQHMLLVGASSQFSTLTYLDVSTGKTVCSKGPAAVKDPTLTMCRNAANGILGTGDLRGLVKLWSPMTEDPLVTLKAHKGAVKRAVFHPGGRFAATLGVDSKLKIWDLRTLRTLEEYTTNYTVDSMDVSANGILALGGGTGVQFWKDVFTTSRCNGPFMKHAIGYGNIVHSVKFCPYEDVLGVGHSCGFSTVLVPGAGEANPDFFQANPYETEEHRKQRVVTNLLDKLPPDTITLDLKIAGVNEERLQEYNNQLAKQRKAKGIREAKQARRDAADEQDRNGGRPARGKLAADAADEVDEELGVTESGVTSRWKPKKEVVKERKMEHWQKKDASDKVRSKQTMRTSQIARQKKQQAATAKILEGAAAAAEQSPSPKNKGSAKRPEGGSNGEAGGQRTARGAKRPGPAGPSFDPMTGAPVEQPPAGERRPSESSSSEAARRPQAKRHRAERPPLSDSAKSDAAGNAALRRFLR